MATPTILIVPDRFKSGVLYSQLPESGAVDFGVTRATTAYRTNASGILESVASGVPRLDYPAAGGCPSLLVEPAATNLVLRSEEFDNAIWNKSNLNTTATPPWVNVGIAPNGTTTAEKLIPNTTNNQHGAIQIFSGLSGTYTYSVFAKADGYNFISFGQGNPGARVYFNLSNGTIVGNSIGTPASSRIVALSNGWYRCSVTITAVGADSTMIINVHNTGTGSESFVGNDTDGVFVWGAQLETGSVATSYIPTVAATATRNADVISKTGVSGFIGQSEGTLYIDLDYNQAPNDANGRLLQVQASLVNETNGIFPLILNNNQFQLNVFVNGGASTPVPASVATTVPFGSQKFAIAYNAGSYTVYRNGSLFASGTGGAPSSLSTIMLGTSFIAARSINNRIRAAAIYPTRLSNAELAALTTL